MNNYRELSPFRMWCQKVIPLVYDDSLSYYEVLCKLTNYINIAIEGIKTNGGDIEALQTAFTALKEYIDNYFSTTDFNEKVETAIDNLVASGEFETLISNAVVDEVNTIINHTLNLNEKTIILIGDSYGTDTAMWTGWQTAFLNLGVGTVYRSAIGGSGFIGDPNVANFQTQLTGISVNDPEKVTDILVCGGYNDFGVSATENDLLNACRSFSEYANTHYPKASIHFAFVAASYASNGNQNMLNQYEKIFRRVCSKSGIKFVENAQYILLNKENIYIGNDANSKFHPSTTGNIEIARKMLEYLMNGYFDVIYGETWNSINLYFKNGDISAFPQGYAFSQILPAMSYPFNEWSTLSNLETTSNLLWGTHNESTTFKMWIPVYDHPGTFINHCLFRIYDKLFQINPLNNPSGLVLNGPSWVCAEGFTIPFQSNYG